ncbi:hypothetical protein [Paenibacillus sp. 1001270B_150601_E10]|uniref:hypothetical protein n=1 Tax=Paenibacillus sp. 1001270B_150601_E10 TaxID=2787079 RepID=UPI00189E9087|nr:hypothetical protein [Paenibacillus sp. 1001270B_150601_E10]
MDVSNGIGFGFAIAPFLFMLIIYLGVLAAGFLILYLVIRKAIDNSKLSQNMEQLRMEMMRMNHQLQSMQAAAYKTENDRDNSL